MLTYKFRFFRYFFGGEHNKKGKMAGYTSRDVNKSDIDAEVLSIILNQLPSATDTKGTLYSDLHAYYNVSITDSLLESLCFNIEAVFIKIHQAILRTTGPHIHLFVLILMHFNAYSKYGHNI